MFEKEDGNKEREESCDNLKQTRVCETSERLKEWWSSLAVMGGDSCSKGCEFESQCHILDGHFFTYLFVVKVVTCVWKEWRTKYMRMQRQWF